MKREDQDQERHPTVGEIEIVQLRTKFGRESQP
jgi:hypothetical protein